MRKPNPSQLIAHLTPRQRKYAEYVASGMTKKDAALKAGYSPKSNSAAIETFDFKMAFQAYVRKRIPAHKIAKRLREGMDAVNTEFFSKDGKVVDSRDTIDYSERRQYTTLAAQMGGYYTPKQEIDHTQRVDETQVRRLMDLADKLNIASLPAERIKQLEASHVPYNNDDEPIDGEYTEQTEG